MCKDGLNSYSCDCSGTGFLGSKCEHSKFGLSHYFTNMSILNNTNFVTFDSAYAWLYHTLSYIFYSDINDCVDNDCVNGHCKDGIKSYTCDCTGTGFRGDRCEIGTLFNPYILYVNTLILH